MKTLKYYAEDCFAFHEKAVEKKHSGELKERLLKINPLVEVEYAIYSNNFDKNTLIAIKPNATLGTCKDDLHTLYNSQSKVVQILRESIRKLQIKTVVSTCQNCTIDSANTFDHILPKSGYPEFVINPKNLFPCCSICNSYKLDAVEDDSGRKFLNLYLDVLPKNQYLFVSIFNDDHNEIDFKYYLENIDNCVPTELFSVIENHYSKLHLYERFKFRAIEYVSEYESKISAFRRRLTIDEIVFDLTTAATEEKEAYGDNHWKCILELSLINSDIFMNRFI